MGLWWLAMWLTKPLCTWLTIAFCTFFMRVTHEKHSVGKVGIKYCSFKNHMANFCLSIRNSVVIRIFRSTFLVPQLRKLGFFWQVRWVQDRERPIAFRSWADGQARMRDAVRARARAELPRPQGRAGQGRHSRCRLAGGRSVSSHELSHVTCAPTSKFLSGPASSCPDALQNHAFICPQGLLRVAPLYCHSVLSTSYKNCFRMRGPYNHICKLPHLLCFFLLRERLEASWFHSSPLPFSNRQWHRPLLPASSLFNII